MTELLSLTNFKTYTPEVQLFLCNNFNYPTLVFATISTLPISASKIVKKISNNVQSINNNGDAAPGTTINTDLQPPMKKGWMKKEGHVVKNWKDRHFVLDSGILIYYENEHYVNERGRLILSEYYCSYKNKCPILELHDNTSRQKHYILETEDDQSAKDWRKAFLEHGLAWEQIE